MADSKLFSNISATTAAFNLNGGQYTVAVVATFGGGSVQLQMLGPDASTWINMGAPFTANGSQNFFFPPGIFRFVVTTATGVFAVIASAPYNR